ncbi:hypothetical protein EMIHUDRAFT_453800 [Emiliania huxleyi CCMP1516]|uniref:DIS3-like exonuclease 1 n=2 Tax=Emiliania huxleyi TaxID=2903 RepID=A0A0D3I0A2_EMIH1|nr:hypothetical protein EMIHUDRAFT_453800 [Emiliania huxleyi CCMP1516]EOD04687.1 hypothetical protein EMIHUDRAFT_453800 [Emiliania huxleyi CCMP1516]|eukprot:XP_005757116.1 hypothetical protein EMIHUDRAFT_453800 [Emiliania huxleyi CCMP1516]
MLAQSSKRSPLSRLAVAQQRRGGPLTGSAAALSTSSTWQWLKSLFSPPTPAPVTQASGPSSVAAGAPAANALQPRGRVTGKLCVAAIDPPPNFDASCAAVARAVAGAETVLLAVCKADLLPQLSPGELESLRRRFERRRPGVSCASAFGESSTRPLAAEVLAQASRGGHSEPLAPLVARLSARPEAVEAGSWRRVPVGVGRKAVLELVGDGGRGGGGEVLGRAEVVFAGGGGGEEEQELAELSAGLLARLYSFMGGHALDVEWAGVGWVSLCAQSPFVVTPLSPAGCIASARRPLYARSAELGGPTYAPYLSEAGLAEGLESGELAKGRLQVTYSNPQNAFVAGGVGQAPAVSLFGRRALNRALHGDEVAVRKGGAAEAAEAGEVGKGEATRRGEGEGEGSEVVGLLRRVERLLVLHTGKEEPVGGRWSSSPPLALPRDGRYPPFELSASCSPGQLASGHQSSGHQSSGHQSSGHQSSGHRSGQLVAAKVGSWEVEQTHPSATVVRVLGEAGTAAAESEALLVESDVRLEPFSDEVEACLPPADWSISAREIARRLDLRDAAGVDIFSIDPPGCVDIDDALHLRTLSPGVFEAASRGETFYLVNTRANMIPPRLSEDLCSLHPHVDRLAFSALFTMDERANLLSTTFAKSVIRSAGALSYADAQERLEREGCPEPRTAALQTLGRLAAAHSLIEEFMVLANCAVARRVAEAWPEAALLRLHPQPEESKFRALARALEQQGMPFRASGARELAASLSLGAHELAASLSACTKPADPHFNHLVRLISTRCIAPAKCFRYRTTLGAEPTLDSATVSDAYVVRVAESGVTLLVPEHGFEGYSHLAPPGGASPFRYDKEREELSAGGCRLRMLDRVRVRISVELGPLSKPRLVLAIVEPKLPKGAAAAPRPTAFQEAIAEEAASPRGGSRRGGGKKASRQQRSRGNPRSARRQPAEFRVQRS